MAIDGVNGAGKPQDGYTKVTVRDKDSGKSFVIDFKNAKVEGNTENWKIENGVVYDKDGKPVDGNVLNVTKYQAALIKAAAEGDDRGEGHRLDSNDLVGGLYGENAEAELQKVGSEYHIAKDTYNDPPTPWGVADAFEHGVIFAEVENAKGEKGGLQITFADADLRTSPPPQKEEKSWWEFWK